MSDGAKILLVDTHCHLHDTSFDRDRRDVISRAREAGVRAAICMGEDYEDNLRLLDIAAKEPFIRPALGHHPWRLARAADDVPRTLKLIEENREALAAIGEVGLDYRAAETHEDRANQKSVFREFIAAAKDLGLPLSVHVRSAGHYVIDLLRDAQAGPAVLHAFDGKARYAREGADRGVFFSIPATILVSPQKQKLVRALPADRILFESDAPALGPEKGVRNEPAVVRAVLEEAARLRVESSVSLAEAVQSSTATLFGSERMPQSIR